MKLTRGTKRQQPAVSTCIATIGNFDGLHRGHRTIIDQVKAIGQNIGCPTTVISFEPLPTEFFSQKFSRPLPGRIYPLRDKARILNQLGINELVCLKFSTALSEMSAEDFISEILIRRLHVKHLVVGDDFRFGKQRRGDFQMLLERGQAQGMQVSNTKTIVRGGERISSTRIRAHLAKGEMDAANKLLDGVYQLSGRVRHGEKRGRTIGFPTLNQSLPDDIIVARGTYAVRIWGLAERALHGVANLGKRPTVSGTETRLETHVFDFNQSVYGKQVCVELVSYLRPEQKFSGLAALAAQIEKDCARAKQILGE